MNFTDVKTLFGTAVRAKRAELRMSQEELADRAGLHRTYISDVERGVRNPSLESIEKLAQALELTVSSLFMRADTRAAAQKLTEILLVEDNQEDVDLTLRAFARAKFTNPIHVVGDGGSALDFVFRMGPYANRPERPLILLLDLQLPVFSGLEVLKRMKAHSSTRHIPVIVLTASRQCADPAECRRLGVESYLVKPVDFQSFSEVTPHLQFSWELVRASSP